MHIINSQPVKFEKLCKKDNFDAENQFFWIFSNLRVFKQKSPLVMYTKNFIPVWLMGISMGFGWITFEKSRFCHFYPQKPRWAPKKRVGGAETWRGCFLHKNTRFGRYTFWNSKKSFFRPTLILKLVAF